MRSLTVDENADLNAGAQRIHSEPQAAAKVLLWHQVAGQFDTPLITLHNAVEPLVSFSQEEGLHAAVMHVGNEANLRQRTVPPVTRHIPMTNVSGLTHCGFTEEELASTWDELLSWTKNGNQK